MLGLAQIRLMFTFRFTPSLKGCGYWMCVRFTAPKNSLVMSIYRHLPGWKANTFTKKNVLFRHSMKATCRTDQSYVPDTLPQRHHLCFHLCIQTKLPVCCSVWKAISIEPLSWNTIVFASVYFVWWPVFVCTLFYWLKRDTCYLRGR